MKHIDAIVFDIDEVLYPALQYVLSGYKAVARHINKVYKKNILESLTSSITNNHNDAWDTIEKVLHSHFDSPDTGFMKKIASLYESHTPEISLYPDTGVCFALLNRMQVKVVLLSNQPHNMHHAKVRALDLYSLTDSVFCTSNLIGNDNTAEALRLIEMDLETPLSRMAYVGNQNDENFSTAYLLGMKTVMIQRQHFTEKEDQLVDPHHVIDSLDKLPAILEDAERDLNTGLLNT